VLLLLPQVVFSNHETKDPGPEPDSCPVDTCRWQPHQLLLSNHTSSYMV
jgi:hypothetical protein